MLLNCPKMVQISWNLPQICIPISFITFWKICLDNWKLVDFWQKNGHLARFRVVFSFNGRYLKIYKSRNNFDHSGPNKLKFGLGSLWSSLKKIIYQIFDILIFRDFLGSKKCRIGKNRQKMAFFGLYGAKKSRKIKISKIW